MRVQGISWELHFGTSNKAVTSKVLYMDEVLFLSAFFSSSRHPVSRGVFVGLDTYSSPSPFFSETPQFLSECPKKLKHSYVIWVKSLCFSEDLSVEVSKKENLEGECL